VLCCFTNISATYFRLQLLRQAPSFSAFLPNAVTDKSIKNYLHKSCSDLMPKMLVKQNPEYFLLNIFLRFASSSCTLVEQWEGINRKQITRWQHLSQLKASAFFSFLKKISCYETQQLILGTGTAIWWVTEPH
jgi:hypothetical protein